MSARQQVGMEFEGTGLM